VGVGSGKERQGNASGDSSSYRDGCAYGFYRGYCKGMHGKLWDSIGIREIGGVDGKINLEVSNICITFALQ
jgi:hypothetical protein